MVHSSAPGQLSLNILLCEGRLRGLLKGKGSQQFLTVSRVIMVIKPFAECIQSICKVVGSDVVQLFCLVSQPDSTCTLWKAYFVFIFLTSFSKLSLYLSLALRISFLICPVIILRASLCTGMACVSLSA